MTFTTGTAVDADRPDTSRSRRSRCRRRQGSSYTARDDRPRRQALRRHAHRPDPPLHRSTPTARSRRRRSSHRPDRQRRPAVRSPASRSTRLSTADQPGPVGDARPIRADDERRTDWTGKISRLSGPDLATYQDYVIGLPRSVRDHLTNQIDFGPDGALYFAQASNTRWAPRTPRGAMRPEHLLSGAILRLDTAAVAARIAAGQGPLDVQTEGGGTLQPVRRRRAADDLRHRRAQRLRPGLAQQRPALRADQRLGRRRQHARLRRRRRPARIDQRIDGPYTGTDVPALTNVADDRERLPLPHRARAATTATPTRRAASTSSTAATRPPASTPRSSPQYPVGTQPDRNYRGRRATTSAATTRRTASIEYHGRRVRRRARRQAAGRPLQRRRRHRRHRASTPTATSPTSRSRHRRPHRLRRPARPRATTRPPATSTSSEYGGRQLASRCCARSRPAATSSSAKPTDVLQRRRAAATQPARRRLSRSATPAPRPLAIPSDGLTHHRRRRGAVRASRRSRRCRLTIPAGGYADVSVVVQAVEHQRRRRSRPATLEVTQQRPRPARSSPSPCAAWRPPAPAAQNEPSLQRILDLSRSRSTPATPTRRTPTCSAPPTPLHHAQRRAARSSSWSRPAPATVTIEPLAVFGAPRRRLRFGWYDAGTADARTSCSPSTAPTRRASTRPPIGTTSFDPGASDFGLYSIVARLQQHRDLQRGRAQHRRANTRHTATRSASTR